MNKSKKLIENVSKMPAAAQQNPTTQANVEQAKGVVVADAQKRIDNISQMRPEARQHPKVQKDLAEAQKVVEEHGQKPEKQAGALSDAQAAEGPASSTQSSSGSLPPGSSATSHGTTPPEGHATGTEGTDGSTGTHTTDGAASDSGGPQTATGTGIPHATTTPQEIDLARKITGNLDKVQARRPLNPVEQQAYDRSRGILDRATPSQPGSRNTGNPKDLVLAGDGPSSQSQGAAAEVPPVAPAQGADAIGAAIQGPGATNPDAPRASANDGSGNARTPIAQQPTVPQQGASPTNVASKSNDQSPSAPAASSQASDSSSQTQSGRPPAPPHRSDSPPEHADPRLKEAFKNWPHGWDEQGFPNTPKTLPEGHELLQPTHEKDTAILPKVSLLVQEGFLPADTPVPRAALHAAIIDYFMHKAEPLPAGIRPTIYVSGGGGGAGKSTILEHLHNRGALNTNGAVDINADTIKELIPEYASIIAAGDGRAADMVHEESSAISKALLKAPCKHKGSASTLFTTPPSPTHRRPVNSSLTGRRKDTILILSASPSILMKVSPGPSYAQKEADDGCQFPF